MNCLVAGALSGQVWSGENLKKNTARQKIPWFSEMLKNPGTGVGNE